MSLRTRWVEVRLRVRDLQKMKVGSSAFEEALASGVDEGKLVEFVKLGCPRKAGDAGRPPWRAAEALIESGGIVAGGAAVHRWLGLDGRPRDVDIFFRDFSSYARAHVECLRDPLVDVCLFQDDPWEFFDLDASRCAFDKDGFRNDPAFERAFETGVSGVRMDCVLHPGKTLERLMKYGERYGLRFPGADIVMLCVSAGVSPAVARRAASLAES